FMKIAPRVGMDFSLAAVAARANGRGAEATSATIVVGSVTTAPLLLVGPSATIAARGLSEDAIDAAVDQVRTELGELTNLYGKPAYKKHLANVLVRRALLELREKQDG